MKRRFTILTAALALLTFLAVPMGMRGQTRAEGDEITSISNIVSGDTYYIKGVRTNNTYYLTFTDAVGSQSGTESSTISGAIPVTFTLVSGNTYTLRTPNGNYIAPGTSNGKINVSATAINVTATDQNSKIRLSIVSGTTTWSIQKNTSAANFGGYKNTQADITLIEAGAPAPSMSVSPASIDFGNDNTINPSEPYTRTFNVTFANLTESLSVNVGSGLTGVSVNPTSIAANATSPQTVTVSYNPTAEGNLSGNITVSSSEVTTASVSVSGSAYDPANVHYYEKVTEASSNWSGEYIFTGINSSNYYALTGVSSNLGTTAQVTVTENGIKSTPTTDGYKVTIAQTTHGYSLYLAGAGYLYYTGSSNNLYAAQTFTANTCEWTFSFANGVATITNVGSSSRILQFNYNSGNPRFACYTSSQVKLTLFKYNDPNKVKAPRFSPEGGIYTAAQNVTISSETSGASIYYTTDGSMPTTESTLFNGAFMVSTTTTVKAIAVKSGMTDSDVSSTTYTFVTPFTTMQQVYEDAVANTSEHEVYITFNNWVITGTNGGSASQFYLTDPDNTYGCVIYGSGSGFTIGNTLNGTVRCKLLYFSSGSSYSFAEIKELTTQTDGLTVGTGGSVTPITTTIDALTSEKTGTVVKLENLTYNGTVLTDNNNNIINNSNYIYSATLSTDKTYNITGVFTYAYAQNNTPKRICPRSADDIEEVIITNPTVTVTPSTINAPFAGADGTLAITYENITEIISFDYYFCDANGNELEDTDPDYPGDWIYAEINEENDAYTLDYTIDANDGAARTAYMKVYTFDDNEEEVYAIVTVNQAKYVVDYATLPFEYDGNGTGTLPAGFTCDGLSTYSSSPKMQFNSTGDWAILKINERPGILTFDIKGNTFSGGTFKVQTSEDGTNYTDLATYTSDNLGSTVQSEEFYNLGAGVRYIKWIYTNKSSGNVALGNIKLAAYVAPNPYNLTVTLNDNVSAIFVYDANNQNNPLIADGAAGTVQVLERTSIMISPDVAQGCILASLMVNNVNVIDQLDGSGAYTFTMPSEDVAITATAMVTTTYTLATTIESGRHYIITNGDNRAMGAQSMSGNSQGNNRTAIEIYINLNDVAQVTSPDVFEFVINGPDADGFYTIYDAIFPGYLYAAGSTSSNHMKTQTFCDNRGQWSISFDEDNAANIVANFSGTNARNTMRYNENNDIFSCYASGNQGPIYLYVKDNDTNYEFYKDIAKYTTPEENQPANGWNLIASPVASVTPSVENGLLSGTYDLYYFDQTGGNNGKEWKNYKTNNFPFVSGHGYLYANSDDVTLKFTGTPNTSGEVPLTYSTTANENMRGWNLVGNPFGRVAYISRNFYRMNDAGTEIVVSTTTSVNPMEGIFVKAADANDNSITFSTTAPEGAASNENQNVVLDVIRNRGTVIDRAIVSFNDGAQLPKLTINENSTKLYIPQDDEDYAIVRTEAQGELPVSFRASENGTYTLSMNVENVDMNYLHLIDNMTGMDVDLLQTPSYTFEANTNDYANRFKLVFAANGTDEADESSFAFFSNGNLIVNNEGNATLQVIDINGRILSSETISGSCSKAINATTGVYMLRLINGDNVKVQKVVVR